MSREIGSFAPNVAAWSKGFEDASSKFQRMAALVKDLDERLQDVTAELDNEVETRKNWMKRANAAETRQKQQQFILMLLDGNQSFFKPDIVRGGASSAQSAVQSLTTEIREAIVSKHKNNLASDIQVVVHIFIDFSRLIGDFVSAGSLSDGQQLQDFTTAMTASTGLLSVTDCGSGQGGIDGKMKEYYELFIENVQCRHIILALDRNSEYFATLDMYSEDAYTLGKTSLVKTTHGFPSKYNLPFHQVEFTSINTVPLISFESEDPPEANSPGARAEDVQPASQPPRSLNNSVHSQQQVLSSGSSSHSNHEGSGSGPSASAPSSHTSRSASNHAGDSAPSPSEPTLANATVSYPPKPSTYDESKASYEHDWERAPSQNNYTPPVCTTPWGFEPEQDVSENIGGPLNAPPREDQRVPRQNYARASAPPKPRQNSRPTPKPFVSNTLSGTSRKVPTSFRGSWDDLVSGNTEDLATTPLSSSVRSPGSVPSEFTGLGDVALNRFGERVDRPLPPAVESDKSRLRTRSKDQKLCNEHHLKRACHNEHCRYDHEGPIDAGMLLALRHLARTQACDVGLRCRMPDCCYGHHCPNRVGGRECKSANCSFKKMSLHHIRDLKVAEVIPTPRK